MDKLNIIYQKYYKTYISDKALYNIKNNSSTKYLYNYVSKMKIKNSKYKRYKSIFGKFKDFIKKSNSGNDD